MSAVAVEGARPLRMLGFADKSCDVCGWRFFTSGGLYDHSLTCNRSVLALQERGRQIARLNNSRRRRCDQCELESTPAALGVHQRHSGHTGWTETS